MQDINLIKVDLTKINFNGVYIDNILEVMIADILV